MLVKLLIVFLLHFLSNLSNEKHHIKQIKKPTNIIACKASLLQLKEKEDLLFTITIDKINIYDRPIYNISSNENNIEKNITILKESILPDKDNSIIFLAAHSGYGNTAYFKDLHQLNINDYIHINYKANIYTYKITDIFEEDKNGYISINKDSNKELILTTCSNNPGKQLIVKSNLIKTN